MTSLAQRTAALCLAVMLAACGGGGSSSSTTNTTPTTPASAGGNDTSNGSTPSGGTPSGSTPAGSTPSGGTPATGGTGSPETPAPGGSTPLPADSGTDVVADRGETAAGGQQVTLTVAAGQSAQWFLAPGSPGALDASSGNTVRYVPPASGTLTTNTLVTVVAVVNGKKVRINIVVVVSTSGTTGTPGATTTTPPLPGSDAGTPAPGLYLVAGNDYGAGLADGNGTAARFNQPWGIARDSQGNLYVADQFNFTVRRIAPGGAVTTLAGVPGASGYADGPAAAARFGTLGGIAVDSGGNVYVADLGNACIRKITPGGTVSTLAGKAGASGSADGTGSAARFSSALGALVLDGAGNLYVADAFAVRKVTPAGVVTTVAGGTTPGGADGPALSARFTGIKGMALDGSGNLYVVDADFIPGPMMSNTADYAAAIRKIGGDGNVTTLAGKPADGTNANPTGYVDGPGAQARFNFPDGLALDGAGNLYVADRGNHVIRRITPAGVVSTVAGTGRQSGSADGPALEARFYLPRGIVADAGGTLYVTDSYNHTVRKVIPGDSVSTLAGAAPRAGSVDGTRTQALFDRPAGLTADAAGILYLADVGNATIRRISRSGAVTTVAGAAGEKGTADGPAAAARFVQPVDVALDAQGNLFVADIIDGTIRRISAGGTVSTFAGVHGTDSEADGPAATAMFSEPRGLAFDAAGNLFVADRGGDNIRRITPQGAVTTVAGAHSQPGPADGTGTSAHFFFPQDMAFDAAGNLLIVDNNGATIRKMTPAFAVSTLAGAPFTYDTLDGTGSAAHFTLAEGIAIDADGNAYVGDATAIRKITPQGVVTTIAGAGAPNAAATRYVYRPTSIVVTGPRSIAFTAGNGVFQLVLP